MHKWMMVASVMVSVSGVMYSAEQQTRKSELEQAVVALAKAEWIDRSYKESIEAVEYFERYKNMRYTDFVVKNRLKFGNNRQDDFCFDGLIASNVDNLEILQELAQKVKEKEYRMSYVLYAFKNIAQEARATLFLASEYPASEGVVREAVDCEAVGRKAIDHMVRLLKVFQVENFVDIESHLNGVQDNWLFKSGGNGREWFGQACAQVEEEAKNVAELFKELPHMNDDEGSSS